MNKGYINIIHIIISTMLITAIKAFGRRCISWVADKAAQYVVFNAQVHWCYWRMKWRGKAYLPSWNFVIGQIARSRRSLSSYPYDIRCVGHHTQRNSRVIQDSMMVARRPPFTGTLLTIQCAPDWSASQSPLGILLKSSSLSLPDVILGTRRLLATPLPPN